MRASTFCILSYSCSNFLFLKAHKAKCVLVLVCLICIAFKAHLSKWICFCLMGQQLNVPPWWGSCYFINCQVKCQLVVLYNYPPKGSLIVVNIYMVTRSIEVYIYCCSPTLRRIVVLVLTKSVGDKWRNK